MDIFIQPTTNYNILTFCFANLIMVLAKQLNTHLSTKKLYGNDGISGFSFGNSFELGAILLSAESNCASYLLFNLYVREILNIYGLSL